MTQTVNTNYFCYYHNFAFISCIFIAFHWWKFDFTNYTVSDRHDLVILLHIVCIINISSKTVLYMAPVSNEGCHVLF